MFVELTPEQFVERRKSGELWQLLDVREPWEREVARIDGAIEIPMGDIVARSREIESNTPVAVICHSGIRSARVAEWLSEQSERTVANIEGGIDAWSRTVDPGIPRY